MKDRCEKKFNADSFWKQLKTVEVSKSAAMSGYGPARALPRGWV